MADITELEPLAGIDALVPIQSQYAASPRMLSLAEGFAERIDHIADVQLFFDDIFNVMTASGVGLDYWARIVGLDGRGIYVSNFDFFGFDGSDLHPWDTYPFWNKDAGQGVVPLSDSALRWLILFKALANISDESMASLNSLLAMFVEFTQTAGNAYILESGVMQIRIVFEYTLTPVEQGMISQYGLFSKGAGVGVDLMTFEAPLFGFCGTDPSIGTFGEGTFFYGGYIANI